MVEMVESINLVQNNIFVFLLVLTVVTVCFILIWYFAKHHEDKLKNMSFYVSLNRLFKKYYIDAYRWSVRIERSNDIDVFWFERVEVANEVVAWSVTTEGDDVRVFSNSTSHGELVRVNRHDIDRVVIKEYSWVQKNISVPIWCFFNQSPGNIILSRSVIKLLFVAFLVALFFGSDKGEVLNENTATYVQVISVFFMKMSFLALGFFGGAKISSSISLYYTGELANNSYRVYKEMIIAVLFIFLFESKMFVEVIDKGIVGIKAFIALLA